jgi:RecB family endonuclease NucS
VTSQLGRVSLRQIAQGWEFANEQALEDFVWSRLEALLQLQPFQRQYAVMGEICDILALSADGQLTILELKNTEDRYVIQQLTRYYANLLEERPFPDKIDYGKPVRLIAFAPTFHRHNHIDRQYSRLSFQFIQVRVVQEEQFYLELRFEEEDRQPVRAVLPYQESHLSSQPQDLADVPELLIKWLGACSAAEQQTFLRTRQQLLSFDSRIQEIVEAKSVQYGTGKTKLCAEICFNRSQQRPVLFLWLPLPRHRTGSDKERIARMRVWLQDGEPIYVGHVTQGLGKMRLKEEWEAIPKNRWPRKHLLENWNHRSHIPIPIIMYARSAMGVDDGSECLASVVSLALQKWLEKL